MNKEVIRRADVVESFPNEASITRLIGAVLFKKNDECQTASRYMMVEAFADIDREDRPARQHPWARSTLHPVHFRVVERSKLDIAGNPIRSNF